MHMIMKQRNVIVVKKRMRIKQNLLPPDSELNNEVHEFQDVGAEMVDQPLSAFQRIGGMAGIMHMLSNIQQMYGLYQNMQPTFKMLNNLFGPQVAVKSVALHRARTSKKTTKRKK